MTEDITPSTGAPDIASSACEPSDELGAGAPLDVAGCVREARRKLEAQPQQDATSGQAIAGNTNTMIIGHRSEQLTAALAPVRQAIERATLSDRGYALDGPERPPETLRITVRNLASLDVLAETFWTWLETRGVLTTKGKTRSAVTTLLSIIDRQTKLVAVLGLERKQRDISSMSAVEYVEELQRARDDGSGLATGPDGKGQPPDDLGAADQKGEGDGPLACARVSGPRPENSDEGRDE